MKVKVTGTIESDVKIHEFSEIDRKDLVKGICEIYGRDGGFPRTDLGTFYIEVGPTSFNIFLESDGTLNVNSTMDGYKVDTAPILKVLVPKAKEIYDGLMKNKYQPLFDKYHIKNWEELLMLNMSQTGLKEYLKSRWTPGKITDIENGLQNGNLGMHIHTWESVQKNDKIFHAYINYYIDFPEEVFKPNCYAGSQSDDEIKKWGKKISVHGLHIALSNSKRDLWIKEYKDKFAKGILVGYDDV